MTDPTSAVSIILGSILTSTPMPEYVKPEMLQGNWAKFVEVANKYNDPGKFTAFIAYEWTSIPNGRNMHRNVYFRDDTGPTVPFSAFDSYFPEDLWTYQEIQRNEGHENLAIPHNGNVSDGWMFAPNKFLAGPMDGRYAKRQARNEPLFEMLQTKGTSDTHPTLSPKLGSNPYKMGLVGGADSHSAYSNNEEFAFHGSHGATDDTPQKRLHPGMSPSGEPGAVVSTAGLTAIWAEENTRASLFDAMTVKETYGTSGTFIRLRFFGSWSYPSGLTSDSQFVKKAYDGGVPMGSDLAMMPAGAKAPTFAGRPDEKIYDVALSDNRKVDPQTGKAPPVGNTVNIKKATYTNDIGDSQLSAVWTDPNFDPAQPAAYYVRVLEIPTPRWTTYDSARNNLPLSEVVPATIQERAWSSPIWYTPAAGN